MRQFIAREVEISIMVQSADSCPTDTFDNKKQAAEVLAQVQHDPGAYVDLRVFAAWAGFTGGDILDAVHYGEVWKHSQQKRRDDVQGTVKEHGMVGEAVCALFTVIRAAGWTITGLTAADACFFDRMAAPVTWR